MTVLLSSFTLALVVFFYPILLALFLFRLIAIHAHVLSGNESGFWISTMGWKIANGRSIPFAILFLLSILFAVSATLFPSLLAFGVLGSNSSTTGYVTPSMLLPSLVIVPMLLAGVVYVTMTDGGLSWWDASVIIFRFNSFQGRRDIMEEAVNKLLERDKESRDNPHRAYLTLIHLFRHKYDAGAVAREVIHEANPETFNETDAELLGSKSHRTMRQVLLLTSIVFFAAFFYIAVTLSLAFLNAPVVSTLTNFSTTIAALSDFSLMVSLVAVLLGIATAALEIPSLQPEDYLKLKSLQKGQATQSPRS